MDYSPESIPEMYAAPRTLFLHNRSSFRIKRTRSTKVQALTKYKFHLKFLTTLSFPLSTDRNVKEISSINSMKVSKSGFYSRVIVMAIYDAYFSIKIALKSKSAGPNSTQVD